MSWLRKILSKLTTNESYTEGDSPHDEQLNTNINARMTYQYPKGKFRFPLIEDPPKTENSPIRRERKVSINPTPVKNESMDVSKSKTNQGNATQTPKRTRPFQLSEIPSPIYGYNRPSEFVPEYELQGDFFKKDNLIEDVVINELQSIETPLHIEEQTDQNIPLDEHVESNLDITEDAMPSAETVESVEFELGTIEIKHESIQNETDPTNNEDDQDRTEEKKEKTARKHIPFNVLMLKKDRKFLDRQESNSSTQHQNDHAGIAGKRKVENQSYEETSKGRAETAVTTEQVAGYVLPPLSLLKPPVHKEANIQWLEEQTALLNETLVNFNVKAHVVHVSQGPSVTRFEIQPDPGVKVNKITNLIDDIKLSMAAKDIRMEAPIPGKRSIGIEIPNQESRPVQISEIISKSAFRESRSSLTGVLGLDISGLPVVTDIQKMPHGLIAGATGSGKSVCINSLLISLLYKARPDELKLLLIDPKMVELAPYNHIPHLVSPVITDVKAATAALKWAVEEMERRYELFAHTGVRDIARFNELATEHDQHSDKLPYIVVVIDELADLMMMAPGDVEESICRIAQKARACGIHLIIATQRPSVDVITGLIKANVPTRIAFSVSSQVDSRTIIDIAGAEKLLGRGDMLFLSSGSSKAIRLQGTFVSDEEIDAVVEYVRSQGKPSYLFEEEELLKKAHIQENEDELFLEAVEFVFEQGNASTSLIQRHFRIGYNRAARLIDMMEQQGIISEAKGSKPRDVLLTGSEYDDLKSKM